MTVGQAYRRLIQVIDSDEAVSAEWGYAMNELCNASLEGAFADLIAACRREAERESRAEP